MNTVEKLGLENVIKFHGYKDKKEIAEFMRNADLFVLPSEWENQPCVLIEALASGLPVVASEVGGIPEFINDSVGILVPPKDTQKLSAALDYMLDNFHRYDPEKIAAYARENFSYEAVANKLVNVYKRIIRSREKS